MTSPNEPALPLDQSKVPLTRPQEQVLLDLLSELKGSRLLCNTAGRAQFAHAFAMANASARVCCIFLDQFHLRRTQRIWNDADCKVELVCDSDPPTGPYDLAAMAFSKHGEAELTRDLIHSAYRQTILGGRLVTTTDNKADTWLHKEMRKLFQKVSRVVTHNGVAYLATKVEPTAKTKCFRCELVFRDRDRLMHLVTRPGVFSHRHVDPGARRLLDAIEVQNGMRILDLGCGSGVVGLALARRNAGVRVLGIDSNPRAVECLNSGAARNGLSNVEGVLDADGTTVPSEAFEMVAANPPYFSHHRISEIFVLTSERVLRADGALYLVTKDPGWYTERLPKLFGNVHVSEHRSYWLVKATKS